MAKLDLDPSVETLLAPTLDGLNRVASALPEGRLGVSLGSVDGFYDLEPSAVVLSDDLAGPALHHPLDVAADVPIDRWRRAAASVLEAVVLHDLGGSPSDWRSLGLAIWKVDRLYPELQVGLADLARARRTGSPGSEPRAGFAVMRALEERGEDPAKQVAAWLGGEPIPPADFLGWGQWVLGPAGAQASLPVPVPRPAARDIPVAVPRFSWLPLDVPPGPRGGRILVEGPGAVAEPWGLHDRRLETLAAATDTEVQLRPDPGGPVGRWAMLSADGFGQVMGARGFTFEFLANGGLNLVLADAFVGPIAALEMAERVGTSGICRGRWRVAGPFTLALAELDTTALTMHGHDDPFVVPAQGLGLAQSIQSMSDGPWRWRVEGSGLWLSGSIQGSTIEVHLKQT